MSDDDDDREGIGFLTKLGIEPGLQQLVLTYGLVAVGLVGFGAYWFGERIRVAMGGHSDDAHVVKTWDHDAALLRDVNGDGIDDVIGVYVGTDGVYIGAFNGKDGKILWRHGTLDLWRPMAGGQVQFGVQGDRILINEKGKGTIIGVADGKPVGSLSLPNAREVCAGQDPDSPLVVQTTLAEKPVEVDLRSSTTKPLQGRRACGRVMTTARAADPATITVPDRAIATISDGKHVVALSLSKSAGVSLHGYAAGKSEPAWTMALAGDGSALVPREGNSLDVAGGRAFVGYSTKGRDERHVLAIDAASGRELWRVPIESPGSALSSLSASPARVSVAVGDYLVVLDAASGKVVLDLGVGRDEP